MIWLRVAILMAVVAVIVVALTQAAPVASPQPVIATDVASDVPPTPRPTRVPLPTLGPEMITSIISREPLAPPPVPTPSAEPQVDVVDYGFSPAQLAVHLGQSVTWTNGGADGHDVTGNGPGGDWRSGPLAPSEHYARGFGLTGTYDYVCTIHPEMRGRIVVQP
jgi:plastocyanin